MKNVFDFAIIGGGPTGALTASLLKKAGYSVCLIEKNKAIPRKVCGEYLCPLGVDILFKHGYQHIIEGFPKVLGMNIVSPSGRKIETDFPDSDQILTYGVSLNRQIFDQRIMDEAINAGVEILTGHTVRGFSRMKNWNIDLGESNVEAKFLIGADGRNSMVAKKLGLKKKDSTKKVALHCFVDRKSINPRYGEMHILEGGYIGLDPTGEHEVNLSLVCDAFEVAKHGGARTCLNDFIKKSTILSEEFGPISESTHISAVTPITNNIKHQYIPDVALVGDAAGFIDPLTGEGIYNSLWMAFHLVELIQEENDFNKASMKFLAVKKSNFRQKTLLNKFFQVIIKYPLVCEMIALFLGKSKNRGDHFVGIIGNIHTPLVGLTKVLKG
jgi:menaquinone-9 beta-reductase